MATDRLTAAVSRGKGAAIEVLPASAALGQVAPDPAQCQLQFEVAQECAWTAIAAAEQGRAANLPGAALFLDGREHAGGTVGRDLAAFARDLRERAQQQPAMGAALAFATRECADALYRLENDFGPNGERTSRFTPGRALDFTAGSGSARVSVETFSGNVRLQRR